MKIETPEVREIFEISGKSLISQLLKTHYIRIPLYFVQTLKNQWKKNLCALVSFAQKRYGSQIWMVVTYLNLQHAKTFKKYNLLFFHVFL